MGRKKKVVQEPTHRVAKTFEAEITYMCPVRGLVTEKATVKKFQSRKMELGSVLKTNEKVDELDSSGDDASELPEGDDDV